MKNSRITAVFCCLALAAAAARPAFAPADARLKVVASVFPLMEFAKAVGGASADVSLLLPPGAGVHTWQPRASDIIKMSEADLFVYVGEGLEPWVGEFLKSISSKRLKVLAVADFLPLEKEKHAREEVVDPHVWLDFDNDRLIVDRLALTYAQLDPAHAALYSDQAAAYDKKLEEIDRLFAENLKPCAHRELLLAGHAAFGYLARRYNLEQISLSGLSPDAEPTPSAVIGLVELARKRHIGSVFMESQESPRLAQLLAREIPAQIYSLNPGENLTKTEWTSRVTFLDLMRDNLKNLKRGLGCD
jgi:zinc transport system substrate-binding protein